MRKIVYISSILVTVSMAVFAAPSFTTQLSGTAFTYSTPTSGTLSCDVQSSGGNLGSVKSAAGSFTVSPQSSTIMHVFSEVTGDSGKVTVTWRGNYIVDTSTGDISSSSMTVTKYIKKKNRYKVSKSVSGTGSYDSVDPNSTTGSSNGTF